MEDVYELSRYFPHGTTDDNLNQYVGHHLASIASCVEGELYSSAYSHLHLLYMAFIYIQLLRIAREKREAFEYGWIGFPGEEKDFLKAPTSPFSFSRVREKTVFRFFRLVGFNDASIGSISSPVNNRNGRLHAGGQLFCASADEFHVELSEYVSRMQFVIKNQYALLSEIYTGLLITYDDEYLFSQDDLESSYIDQYLFSENELALLSEGRSDKVSIFIQGQYT